MMKKKAIILGLGMVLFLSVTTVHAMGNSGMIDILTDLTNKSEEEIKEMRLEQTYGEIAKDENVYEEFKEARVSAKIAHIERKVAEGKITAEQGEEYINRFLEKSENCDGNKVEMKFGNGKRNR